MKKITAIRQISGFYRYEKCNTSCDNNKNYTIVHVVAITAANCYQTTIVYNYTLYILCRPPNQGLVFDEQSSTNSTDMCYVRVHRQNCRATNYGQPQTDGAEEHTHCI